MTIALACPECDASFKVKDAFAVKKAHCPHCKSMVSIPLDDEEKTPPRSQNLFWFISGGGFVILFGIVLFLVLNPRMLS